MAGPASNVIFFLLVCKISALNSDCTDADYGRPNCGHFKPNKPDPLLDALILGKSLNVRPKIPGFNSFDTLPINPYLALLLSHYGQYLPIYGTGRGLYGYTAVNNYHNNKPFGAYKVYEDNDS